jgi:hypothetical protein
MKTTTTATVALALAFAFALSGCAQAAPDITPGPAQNNPPAEPQLPAMTTATAGPADAHPPADPNQYVSPFSATPGEAQYSPPADGGTVNPAADDAPRPADPHVAVVAMPRATVARAAPKAKPKRHAKPKHTARRRTIITKKSAAR